MPQFPFSAESAGPCPLQGQAPGENPLLLLGSGSSWSSLACLHNSTPCLSTLKGNRTAPKICRFSILILLKYRRLKNSKCSERFSLNSPHLPEDRASQRNSVAGKSPPQRSAIRSPTGEDGSPLERGLEGAPRQTTLDTNTEPPIFPRAHSACLTTTWSPKGLPSLPLPFPVKVAFNPEF